jgi:lantibiotic transport system permease protein
MKNTFLNMLYCEILKTRRSNAIWLVLAGGLVSPLIIIMSRLLDRTKLPAVYAAENFWIHLWTNTWEVVVVMLLPIGIVLTTSLLAQIEFRNNAWKQVHTFPISAATVYFSKLLVVLVYLLLFFLVLNLGIFLAAIIPAYFASKPLSIQYAIPYEKFFSDNLRYFLASIPIVTLQFAISLQFKNFMTPLGVGMTLWIATITAVSWRWIFLSPFSLPVLAHLAQGTQANSPMVNMPVFTVVYSFLFAVVGFFIFSRKAEKG